MTSQNWGNRVFLKLNASWRDERLEMIANKWDHWVSLEKMLRKWNHCHRIKGRWTWAKAMFLQPIWKEQRLLGFVSMAQGSRRQIGKWQSQEKRQWSLRSWNARFGWKRAESPPCWMPHLAGRGNGLRWQKAAELALSPGSWHCHLERSSVHFPQALCTWCSRPFFP